MPSCKTEPSKHFWQIMDGLGNEMNIACDKTETVLKERLINGSCGNVAAVITRCNFITGGEKHYCLVNGNYFEDITGNKRSTLKGLPVMACT